MDLNAVIKNGRGSHSLVTAAYLWNEMLQVVKVNLLERMGREFCLVWDCSNLSQSAARTYPSLLYAF